MFESMTYENIIANMLAKVTSDVDKREGSVIYDALAPIAYLLASTYLNLESFIDLVSGDTAVGEYLDRVVADYGIIRKAATYAIRKVTTTGSIDIGTRFGLNDTTYAITALISENVYSATCEQTGIIGNTYSGTLEAIDYVGTVVATLTDIVTSGEPEETDDNLRTRFYSQIQKPSTSGNSDHYKQWALEVPGCGDAKVFPLWNGAGTVKVLVVDENMAIDAALPGTVASYIETVRPIGASVTVECPTSKTVGITANITLDGTRVLADILTDFTAAFINYLKGTIFESYIISFAKVGSILLATEGLSDYSDLLVNGSASNVTIASVEMPIAGTITLTEVV